jgi:hypothetical protein
MKSSALLNEEETSPQHEGGLRGWMERIPFLKLISIQRDAMVSPHTSESVDQVVQVQAGERTWTLLVEELRLGQPREVRTATLQLERHLRSLPEGVRRYGVVLAPFLSEESARICAEAGVGYVDLAGNARLSFDQVFIETQSPGNPFREKREKRSMFAPRATRVLRVLLQGPLRPWKVQPLAVSARVSLGWVSAVRQALLAREWAAEVPGGLQVTRPKAILAAWAKADDWEKRTQTREYSVLVHEPLEMAEKLKGVLSDGTPVFTQWFAAWLRHPYTSPPVVTAYVKRFPDEARIQETLLGRRVDRGGGKLRLVLPKDEGVLHPSQSSQGFELVSDVQIVLDLQQAGLRAEEQAEELKRWPDFAGGWA